jgi:hypothetical protein
MTETIMPCFDRYPKEGNIIGRLLAGYGELELEMCDCVDAATNDLDAAIRKLFGIRGEAKRIKMADSLMKGAYTAAGLGSKYKTTMAKMDWCRTVRNQYAHCNWYDTVAEGLCFIDLERSATLKRRIVKITRDKRPLDVSILERQEAYFKYVQKCFWHLAEAYRRSQGQKMSGGPLHNWPKRIARPRKSS